MNNMYAHEIEKLKSKVKQAKNALENKRSILQNKRSILQNKTKTTNYIFGRLKHYADEYDGEYNSLVSTAQLVNSVKILFYTKCFCCYIIFNVF